MTFARIALLAGAFTLVSVAHAEEAKQFEPVQVTATREAEPIDTLPASVTVVTGEELRARGAHDLRTALALVGGAEGTPTGDSGPAGSTPALWGLREVDAFLLVIDGVPAGGAFNPATTQVDLNGVERIEILRGAAPVMYGATSFNGVIHVIHYAPGKTAGVVGIGGGSHGGYGASASADLPAIGGYKQSLVANVEKVGYKTDREDYDRYHALYRGAVGDFHLDGDVSILRQTPGSVIFRNGGTLRTDILSPDANHNPSDAKLDQDRVQLNAGFATEMWATTVSVTRTTESILRGFLRDYAPLTGNLAADPAKPDDFDADGYDQKRQFLDVYFDTHVAVKLAPAADLTYGIDYLHGRGKQNANNWGYYIGLDGANPPDGGSAHHDEIVRSEDTRDFGGLYAQLDWKASETVDVLAGLRLNHTREKTEGEEILNDADQMASQGVNTDSRRKTRPGGVIGVNWSALKGGNDLNLYADYRNTYKPLAVDFGPEAEVAILQPETSDSYEVGARGNGMNGRLRYDLSLFQMDFRNLKTLDTLGNVVNAGKTRFRGGEIETRFTLVSELAVMANYSYHDSRFLSFNRDGTPNGQVDGNRVELAPYHLAAAGIVYAPGQGLNASLVSNYVGDRQLNKSNTLKVGGYSTLDASIGWRFEKFSVAANGYNLGDKRVPIAESELSEAVSGASSYYFLPARAVMLNVSMPLP